MDIIFQYVCHYMSQQHSLKYIEVIMVFVHHLRNTVDIDNKYNSGLIAKF
jgi:hypothetical protein